MSNPDQAPGYDGEPTYAQDEYNEYLRWREETSHRPGKLPRGPGGTYSPGPSLGGDEDPAARDIHGMILEDPTGGHAESPGKSGGDQ